MLTTIVKTGQVLELFKAERPEWGVTELALTLNLPKSNVHDLLSSLASIGLLQRTSDSRYRLGWRVMSMAQGVTDASTLRKHAPRFLQNLARLTGETTHLAVWDGQHLMFVGRALAENGLVHPHARYGSAIAAYATASGKVLLSELQWDEVIKHAAIDGFVQRTPSTITDFETLKGQLAEVSMQGFATNLEEADEGTCALAVPVRGSNGRVIAALGVSTTPDRFDALRARHTQAIIRTSAGLSAAILNEADVAVRPGVAAKDFKLTG